MAKQALTMSKLRSGYRLVTSSLPTLNHFCGRVEVMDPFINKMECEACPQKMHTHARFYIYFVSRDERECKLSLFSLTKCVAASRDEGEELFKIIFSTLTAPSLLALEGPPAADAGCYGNLEGQLQVSFASRMLAAKGGSLEG